MPSPLEKLMQIESVLSEDRQTRVPDAVIRALGIQPGDRLRYRLDSDGSVRIENPDRETAPLRSELSPLLVLAAGLMQGGDVSVPPRLDAVLGSLQQLLNRDAAARAPHTQDDQAGSER